MFRVLFFLVVTQAAVSSPPLCTIHRNQNKKVENLLTDMKKQLEELQRQLGLVTTKGRARLGNLQHYVNLYVCQFRQKMCFYMLRCVERLLRS